MFRLCKLSSGTDLNMETNSEYLITEVLKMGCCDDCVEEAKGNVGEYSLMYELLATSCGAEYHLDEDRD